MYFTQMGWSGAGSGSGAATARTRRDGPATTGSPAGNCTSPRSPGCSVVALSLLVVAGMSGCGGDDVSAPVVSVAGVGPAAAHTPDTVHTADTLDTVHAPPRPDEPDDGRAAAVEGEPSSEDPPKNLRDDEQRIEALIERYWQVVFAANDPPNPAHPGWDEVATPSLAERRRSRSAEYREDGIGIAALDPSSPFNLGGMVSMLSDDSAIALHCLRDFAHRYDLASGDRLEEVRVVAVERIGARRLRDGWRVHFVEFVRGYGPGEEQRCLDSLVP